MELILSLPTIVFIFLIILGFMFHPSSTNLIVTGLLGIYFYNVITLLLFGLMRGFRNKANTKYAKKFLIFMLSSLIIGFLFSIFYI